MKSDFKDRYTQIYTYYPTSNYWVNIYLCDDPYMWILLCMDNTIYILCFFHYWQMDS